MRTAKLFVYLCTAVLLIIGIYSIIYLKDIYQGIIWLIFGIIILILGYIRVK